MTHELAPFDVLVVVLYILATTVLGAWFARRQRDLKTYFVGDRNVSWWLVLVSIVATETSTVTFLSIPGVAYDPKGGNFTFLQLALGYILGRILVAWIILPQYFKGELFSAYQLLRDRFNPAVQKCASGLFLITRTVADGLRLYLTGLLVHVFTDWNIELAIVVMALITILYTYLGGMQAVIWTDLIQFAIYIAGAVIAGLLILHLLPGGVGEYLSLGRAADKFAIINTSLNLRLPYTLLTGVVGGAFFTMASHGADQLMVQRYLCSRSLRAAQVALVLSGLVVFLQFLLFLAIGVGLFALTKTGALPEHVRNDQVFGLFIVRHLPVGVVGLVVAAVLAAAMSTLSSSLNSSANAFVTDFYRPLRPGRSEEHYLRLSRFMTSVWGAAQTAVALAALRLESQESVVAQVLAVAGFTTGMVLGLFLLGGLKRPVSSPAALAGMVAGFAAVTAVWLPATWGQPLLAWPWYAPIGTLVTVCVGLVVNRLDRLHGSFANRIAESRINPAG